MSMEAAVRLRCALAEYVTHMWQLLQHSNVFRISMLFHHASLCMSPAVMLSQAMAAAEHLFALLSCSWQALLKWWGAAQH